MQTSESIKNISAALLEVQKDMPEVEKGAINPFYKSSYAALDEIQSKLHPILAKHGVTYSQMPETGVITTLVMHPASGEWISSACELNSKEHTPQAMGSAITYAKRYALVAIFGVIIKGEDDDGNQAPTKTYRPAPLPEEKMPLPTENGSVDSSEIYVCPAPSCGQPAAIKQGISKMGKPWKALQCSAVREHHYWNSAPEYKLAVKG